MCVGQLTGRVMRQAIRSAIEVRQDSSTLERRSSDTVVGETPPNDAISFCKRSIDVPAGPVKAERNITGDGVVQAWRPLFDRNFLIGHRGELLVINRDSFQC